MPPKQENNSNGNGNGNGNGNDKKKRSKSTLKNQSKDSNLSDNSSNGNSKKKHHKKSAKIMKEYSLTKIPDVEPRKQCLLRKTMLTRVKDWLLLEQELLKRRQVSKQRSEEEVKEQETLEKIRGQPMMVGVLEEQIDDTHAIVSIGPAEIEFLVPIKSIVDKEQLEPNCKILINGHNLSVVGILKDDSNPLLVTMRVDRAPNETFEDIGGLEEQIRELRETVELPLTNPELFDNMGIKPPKGVILYGLPGTGKTLLAKAVANSTSATFLHVVGSELVQKTLGEGPKLVRDMFKLAADYAPTIIFIDEIDAIGNKREDSTSSGDKEVQRTMLELLNQLDGFDKHPDIKIIMATNRIQALDPALIRPGRIDRKIEIPLPDSHGKRKIFALQQQKMTTDEIIDVDKLISDDELSGADIKAMCLEAGFLALRERRMRVTMADFMAAKDRVLLKKKDDEKNLYL